MNEKQAIAEVLDEQGRELRDAYKMLRDTARLHKTAETKLTKTSCNMSIQEIQRDKGKILELRKSMNSQIRKK